MAEPKTLVIERVFDAPVERVWAAWTVPEEISKWWGPEGFSSPENKVDFRVGGKYVYCMRPPKELAEQFGGGNDLYSTGTYKEIIEYKKIVTTDSFSDKDGNIVAPTQYGMAADFPAELLITLDFEDLPDGKTKLTLTHEGMPAGESADQTEVGWNQSLDKLAVSLR